MSCTQLETSEPIDWTPGTPGSDKNGYYHIRRYTLHRQSFTDQIVQSGIVQLSAVSYWALGHWGTGQPRKEWQFPAFGNLHKSPSWRQASGQTVEFDEEESMVGWKSNFEFDLYACLTAPRQAYLFTAHQGFAHWAPNQFWVFSYYLYNGCLFWRRGSTT